MKRSSLLFLATLIFALSSTILLGVHFFAPIHPLNTGSSSGNPSDGSSNYSFSGSLTSVATPRSTLQTILSTSPILSPVGWASVGVVGAWIWRGRTKSRWKKLGFDSAVFDLFMKMKGAQTRLHLLDALSLPKDRLQLAQELEIDWKAVDYQITLLSKYGLVHEEQAFGKVRMYRLTTLGETLLKLLKEFNSHIEKKRGIKRYAS